MASLHILLDNDDLDISKMKELLENDPLSINNKNNSGETPLVRVLKSEKCSEGIVEMFLNHGADPNSKDNFLGSSALMIAIRYHRDKNILRVLLQKGGDVSQSAHYFQSFYKNSLTEYVYKYQENCLVEIVEHFIQSGVDVNRLNDLGHTLLITALFCCRDKEIIRAILAGGADPNMHDVLGRYPLCIALRKSHSVDVIKMLLNAGSTLNGCMVHGSVLHCATNDPATGLNEDVLQLLLQRGADVRRVDKLGQSLLCFSLPRIDRPCDIKLLLKAGASLDACSKHSSPLLCATDVTETTDSSTTKLTEDVINLLVGEGASVDVVNDEGLSPLELALKNRCYETEVIQLLFKIQISNTKCARWNEYVLHFALSNTRCKLSVLKFLINNGALLDKVNSSGDSLLHVAIAVNLDFKSSIIRFLLKIGTPVNVKNTIGKTPLALAVRNGTNISILQMMLAAGARVNYTLMMQMILPKYDLLECLKLLLKYAFLQNPDFQIGNLFQGYIQFEAQLASFCAKCLNEVYKMDSKSITDGCSFRQFLNELYLPRQIVDDHNLEVNYLYFNRLLNILIAGQLPLFSDVIISKIGRKMMEMKLQELKVSAVKFPGNVQVVLNYYSVCNIATYLSDDDLLQLILAFHNVDNNDKWLWCKFT